MAEDIAARVLAMEDAIWFTVGGGPRSLGGADGLREPLLHLPEICRRPDRRRAFRRGPRLRASHPRRR